MLWKITNRNDAVELFPNTVSKIQKVVDHYMSVVQESLDTLIDIPDDQRSFEKTAQALDNITSISNLAIIGHTLGGLEFLSPRKEIRDAAHAAIIKTQAFWVDAITSNKKLYRAFKAYVQGNANKENLTAEQRYFLQDTMDDFKRAGLDLPDEKLEAVRTLKKDLAQLTLKFETAIADDQSSIMVAKEGLAGLQDDFISTLKQTDDGKYILTIDYPTYFNIMENCSVTETRKPLWRAFMNRAYPGNKEMLQKVIAKRDELARLIGFESYAHMDLDSEMVKSPERAEQFLTDLISKARKKQHQEFEQLSADLPESVVLTPDGKMKSWDYTYAITQYKKKHLAVDEEKISEYFPMEKTVEGLLDIYEKFLSLRFKYVPVDGVWHDEVKLVEVYDAKGETLLGYLFLDLYPRPNKYSHAAHATIVPSIITDDGRTWPSISIVIANFPEPTETKPSLLKRRQVNTFFHEFGHALHAILGRTTIGSFSGTNTKTDFVELPSQMLEEWLWDKDILKKISGHYKTGEPLPDTMIDDILAIKRFDSGTDVQSQLFLAKFALALFKPGAEKDIDRIFKELYEAIKVDSALDSENHMYASFGHLTGYGAKYYGYLWSKVFALDLFEHIKKSGLLDAPTGQRYIDEVIGKGGSVDPNELLKNFLGREPNQEAFLHDLGL